MEKVTNFIDSIVKEHKKATFVLYSELDDGYDGTYTTIEIAGTEKDIRKHLETLSSTHKYYYTILAFYKRKELGEIEFN